MINYLKGIPAVYFLGCDDKFGAMKQALPFVRFQTDV